MVTKKALKECGYETLKVGDTFSMSYGTYDGIQTGNFKISGIWDGYGPKKIFYVSKEFLEGQRITGNTGWVTGKVYKIWPQDYERSVDVSLDSETNVLSAYVNSLTFSKKGTYYQLATGQLELD